VAKQRNTGGRTVQANKYSGTSKHVIERGECLCVGVCAYGEAKCIDGGNDSLSLHVRLKAHTHTHTHTHTCFHRSLRFPKAVSLTTINFEPHSGTSLADAFVLLSF